MNWVVAIWSATAGASSLSAQLDPDAAVLDITMPGKDGFEATRQLKQSGCRAKLVFLAVHEDSDYVRAGLQAGGSAYVIKARLASDLTSALSLLGSYLLENSDKRGHLLATLGPCKVTNSPGLGG